MHSETGITGSLQAIRFLTHFVLRRLCVPCCQGFMAGDRAFVKQNAALS
jgi:hypothetical protein